MDHVAHYHSYIILYQRDIHNVFIKVQGLELGFAQQEGGKDFFQLPSMMERPYMALQALKGWAHGLGFHTPGGLVGLNQKGLKIEHESKLLWHKHIF